MMFSHVMVGSNDLERSRRFYDALFGKPARIDPLGRLLYGRKGAAFMVTRPIDGEPACHANGGTLGFSFDCTEEVDAWHKAGVEAGGTPIEDPPGWREGPFGRVYLAYLRDPDGNKLNANHRPAD
jgi:catechol 2,3-dioxygenase-like lactoylglutathione lyase family enzyme